MCHILYSASNLSYFRVAIFFAALLGFAGSYFITILYFYKKKKLLLDREVDEALKVSGFSKSLT